MVVPYLEASYLEVAPHLEATCLKAPYLEVAPCLEAPYLEVAPYLEASYLEVAPYLEASYLEVAPYLEARRRRTSRWTLRADRATRPPGVGGPGGSVASSAVHGGNGIDLPLEGP